MLDDATHYCVPYNCVPYNLIYACIRCAPLNPRDPPTSSLCNQRIILESKIVKGTLNEMVNIKPSARNGVNPPLSYNEVLSFENGIISATVTLLQLCGPGS